MGFWEDRKERRRQAAEDAQRQAEEDKRIIREHEEERKKKKKELWHAIGADLAALGQGTVNLLGTLKEKEVQLQRMVSDPTALDGLSDVELEHLRITTESEILKYGASTEAGQDLIPTPTSGTDALVVSFGADILHKKRLLLRLVKANQERRSRPAEEQPPTSSDRRKQVLEELQELMVEKADTIKQMQARDASDEEIRQLENLYDDGIQRKQLQLRKILGQ